MPDPKRQFSAGDIMSLTRTALAVAAGMGVCAMAPHAAWAAQITGAGSTFAQPVYQKWADLSSGATGVTLNYQGVGSGAGQKLVFQRTVDFGASDAPVPAAKLAQNKLLQFPSVIGAVDIAVNLPGVAADQLKLDGPTIAAIYMGIITTWNDPAIAKLNAGLKLPDLAIAPVYRADGSGTTYVFTGYLAKVSPDFKSKVGVDKAVSWPAGTGAKGTAGVAGAVKNTVGGLGYVESAYASLNHLVTAQLKAHDGAFLKPTQAAFSAAASNADWAGAKNFAVDMNDLPGAQSWPIESATFVLLPTNPTDAAKGQAVLKFFGWGLDNGDAGAESLLYIPLPAAVKTQVRAAWAALK
jgi:phosphate transport system substrate-binding protein